MTVRNTVLLEQVMQHIDDHPEQHDQAVWLSECGTAACFAGWACMLSGWNMAGHPYAPMVEDQNGNKAWVEDKATELLGLTGDESFELFAGGNARDMLRLMVKDLVNGDQLRDRYEYRRQAHT